jgi:hypothetical protein
MLLAGWLCCLPAGYVACRLVMLLAGWLCCLPASYVACRLVMLLADWFCFLLACYVDCHLLPLLTGCFSCLPLFLLLAGRFILLACCSVADRKSRKCFKVR